MKKSIERTLENGAALFAVVQRDGCPMPVGFANSARRAEYLRLYGESLGARAATRDEVYALAAECTGPEPDRRRGRWVTFWGHGSQFLPNVGKFQRARAGGTERQASRRVDVWVPRPLAAKLDRALDLGMAPSATAVVLLALERLSVEGWVEPTPAAQEVANAF